jgi:hypothetical protein
LFILSDSVVLASPSAATVYGRVPEGKTLYVLSNSVSVTDNAELEVLGTLEITAGATFYARAIPGTNGTGTLKALGGTDSITGLGKIYLPIVLSGTFDGISYTSDKIGANVVKVAASVVKASAATAELVATDIAEIFNASPTITDELTVEGITATYGAIVSASVPKATNKLTLLGTNSLATNSQSYFEPVGEVVVKGTLSTPGSGGMEIKPYGSSGKITIDVGGTLTLADAADKITDSATPGAVVNNGTITTLHATAQIAELRKLLALTGTGTIQTSAVIVFGALTDPEPLNQNLYITGAAVTAPTFVSGTNDVFTSANGNTITVGTGGTLNFGVTDFEDHAPGVSISTATTTNGAVVTATTNDKGLAVLFGVVGGTGAISSSGAVTLSQDLDIPEGINLTATAGTFVNAHAVTIEGTATFPAAAAFTNVTSITVSEGATATFNSTALAAASVTIDGTATFVNAVTLPTTINVGSKGVANFSGNLAPAAAAAIDIAGTANITGNLTPYAGGTLGVSGTLNIGTGTFTLADPTTIEGKLNLGTGILAAGTSDLTVTGELSGGSSVTGSTAKIIASTGVITVGNRSYKTTGDVLASAITGIIAALEGDVATLTNTSSRNLAGAFSKIPSRPIAGIGSLTTAASAQIIQTSVDGSSGTALTDLDSDTEISGTPNYAFHDFSKDEGVAIGDLTIDIDTQKLRVVDGAYSAGSNKFVIVTVKNLVLENNDVAVTVDDFNIGVKAVR